MRRIVLVAPLLLIAACHSNRDDPGAVSPEEDRMLNEAAATQEAPSPVDNNAQAATDGNQQ